MGILNEFSEAFLIFKIGVWTAHFYLVAFTPQVFFTLLGIHKQHSSVLNLIKINKFHFTWQFTFEFWLESYFEMQLFI